MQQRNTARQNGFIFTVGNMQTTFSVQAANIADLQIGESMVGGRDKDIYVPNDKIETMPADFTILCSEHFEEWVEMYKWMLACKNTTTNYRLDKAQTCELTVLDSQNQESTRFIYEDAFPTQMSGLQFNLMDQSTVLTFDVTLRYNELKIVTLDGTIITQDYTG